MPDIFLGKRNFYSFRQEISSFRNKYGKEYFSPFDMITPAFTKTAPKNFLEFFSPQSDKDFKKQHPAGYVILIIIALIALVLPMVLLTVGIGFLPDEDVGFAFFLPAMLGCFVIGVGLFNIVAAFIHQYLGHALTAICLLGGGGIVAFSVIMMVNPHLYDNDVMFYYFISLLLLFVCALVFYPLFRISVDYWLKNTKKLKAPAINKSKKSFKDYLWYERLHKTSNLGAIYYLNKIFYDCIFGYLCPNLAYGLHKSNVHSALPFANYCIYSYGNNGAFQQYSEKLEISQASLRPSW
jgi:hypothetical protein